MTAFSSITLLLNIAQRFESLSVFCECFHEAVARRNILDITGAT